MKKWLKNSILALLVAIIMINSTCEYQNVLAFDINEISSTKKYDENLFLMQYQMKESIPYTDNNPSENFRKASDDTIVCYMDGYPIRKRDIDDNHCVKKQIINNIVSASKNITYGVQPMSSTTTKSSGLPTKKVSIPKKYNNAIIQSTIGAPRYSQTNKTYYFTKTRGIQYANNLEYKVSAQLIALVTGFTPKVGAAIAISFTFSSLYKSSVASDIRKRTDKNKKVRINEASSSFGTFYGVFDWSGRKIEVPQNYNNGTTTQKLKNLQYK